MLHQAGRPRRRDGTSQGRHCFGNDNCMESSDRPTTDWIASVGRADSRIPEVMGRATLARLTDRPSACQGPRSASAPSSLRAGERCGRRAFSQGGPCLRTRGPQATTPTQETTSRRGLKPEPPVRLRRATGARQRCASHGRRRYRRLAPVGGCVAGLLHAWRELQGRKPEVATCLRKLPANLQLGRQVYVPPVVKPYRLVHTSALLRNGTVTFGPHRRLEGGLKWSRRVP